MCSGKWLILLPVFICIWLAGIAQKKHTLSGYIKDFKTGEQLAGATLQVKDTTGMGITANEYGFYSISLSAGNYLLIAGAPGYAIKVLPVSLSEDQKLDIQLESGATELGTVVVSSLSNNRVTSAQMGVENLSMKEINRLPVLFGERDILKTVQLLPGVKSAGEGNSGFYVRGGAADQNLILLDEALVYNPSHLFGFFSTFNSDAIKDVALYKGNMPAQYGGRLSSVMDVKMKDGNDQEYHAEGGLGLIASRLSAEGPITKNKGSFLVSGRRTYADLFLKISNDTQANRNQLYFYDLNLKANYRLGKKDRIYLSGYAGYDKLGLAGLFGLDWGNSTATFRWNHQFNSKLFANTSLIYSDYRYNININNNSLQGTIQSRIKDWNLKEVFSLFLNNRNTLRMGFATTWHTTMPGRYTGDLALTNLPDNYRWENAVFINNSWKASAKLNVEYGLRVNSFSVMGGNDSLYELDANGSIIDTRQYAKGSLVQTYLIPEPRVSAGFQLNNISSVKAAYSRNSQYLHLVSNSAAGNPTDKWVSTNNIIRPEIADQFSIGYFHNFKDNRYEFSIESYYKFMRHQIDYRNGVNIFSNDPIEPQLLFGIGRAYGVEWLLRKKTGRFSGWIGYTLSRTERKIDGINENNWYVARQDRTHDLSVVSILELNTKWTLSGTWVYYTGNAISFPSGKYLIGNQVIFYYTERNGYRMPAYHRLDVSTTCRFAQHKRFSSELTMGIYNAYGRQNAYAITFRQDPDDANHTQAVQTALFRFIPSLTYNLKF